MNNDKMTLEKKITNSKFGINKNFLYFLIAPLVILLIGLIVLCSAGFNLGLDFTGGTTFKLYVNNEEGIITKADVENYDIELKSDYDEVYSKIKAVLDEKGVKIEAYRKTGMSVLAYNLVDGQAVEVTYQNISTKSDEIAALNSEIRNALIAEFNYQGYEEAVSQFDQVLPTSSYSWVIGLVSATILALVVASIYIMARFGASAGFVSVLMLAFDVFMTFGLMLICRVPVNMTIGIIVLLTIILSLVNVLVFYSKTKTGIKAGRYERMSKNEISDQAVKDMSFFKTIIYMVMFLITIILASIAVNGVRWVALGLMFAVIVTYYTSQFLLPTIWATLHKDKKKKSQYAKEQK